MCEKADRSAPKAWKALHRSGVPSKKKTVQSAGRACCLRTADGKPFRFALPLRLMRAAGRSGMYRGAFLNWAVTFEAVGEQNPCIDEKKLHIFSKSAELLEKSMQNRKMKLEIDRFGAPPFSPHDPEHGCGMETPCRIQASRIKHKKGKEWCYGIHRRKGWNAAILP